MIRLPGFVELLDETTRSRLAPLLLGSGAAGGLGALLIPLLHLGVAQPTASVGYWVTLATYTLALYGAFRLRRDAATRATMVLEERLGALHCALYGRLLRAPLRTVEARDDLADAFTRDMERLAELPRITSGLVVNAALLLGLTLYVALISTAGLVIWLILGAIFARVLRRTLATSLDAASDFDRALGGVGRLTDDMLRGGAQIKLDQRLADDLAADVDDTLSRTSTQCHRRDDLHRDLELEFGLLVRAALAGVLFALAGRGFADTEVIVTFASIAIFAEGPLVDLVHQTNLLVGAESAWQNLTVWRAQTVPEHPASPAPRTPPDFQRIELRGVAFRYDPGTAFALGPLDLSVREGEWVFVVGGNGSGKTTLMKLLCGLYPPSAGQLYLDDRPAFDVERWRALFSVVFAEHRLFDRAYGLEISDRARVEALLARFALSGITALDGDRFTHLELSSGQARRLAMVVALLEDRPVLVLDEWAAHQDPALRRWFYETLLPDLRARGKTIIAVSHDDRFFHLADRVLRLDGGRLIDDVDQPRERP